MVRSTWLAAVAALVALAPMAGAHAQSVHKCIINGNAVYQAAPCPAANEQKSLVIPAPPSQQELLDATANGRLQSVDPAAPAAAGKTPRRYERNAASAPQLTPSEVLPETPAEDNCDQLNRNYREAQYRRDELSAPGTGANRAAALQRAWEDMSRAEQQAAATQCHLR